MNHSLHLSNVSSAKSDILLPRASKSQVGGFPRSLPQKLEIILGQSATAFSVRRDKPNPYVLQVGGRPLNCIVRDEGLDAGQNINKHKLAEINESLETFAESAGAIEHVWCRVAKISNGIEVDLGDDAHTRFQILPGSVKKVAGDSEVLFFRSPFSRPMAMPDDVGDFKLLKQYVNLDHVSFLLLRAWLTYTLAHPKVESSKYVILSLLGGQGSGKSFFSKLVRNLLDPSSIDVQLMPSNTKDLAVAARYAHVLCYDNLRNLTPAMSDALCVTSTGGSISSRQLYTDGEQHVSYLHAALVLNGIHPFINQPDLAQRCLPLQLQAFAKDARKSEVELHAKLVLDLPKIQRGLFEDIAAIFEALPRAVVTNQERMLDFCTWLAAMEIVDGAGAGNYQDVYSDALNQGQRDALQDTPLGAAMLEFGESLETGEWTGTPVALLEGLNFQADRPFSRSYEWPDNAIALSKRLHGLEAALSTQGVHLSFARGKERTITVKKVK